MTAIAVTGKGGTGKTLVSALLIHFIAKKSKRLLAVDADPDSNLADALGVEVEKTLGDVREIFQTSRDEMGTMNKEQWLEGKIYETICECNGFDLLVMGRPEGEGCYCFANSLLRSILRKLTKHYDFVIIDCEAGLEHFSIKELKLKFKDVYLIANRIASEDAEKRIKEFAELEGMKLLEVLPYDEKVVEIDVKGLPIVSLDDSSEVYRKMGKVADLFLKG